MPPALLATGAEMDSPPFRKQPHQEPIPGYRLIEPIGLGGFGEVWKCEAPGGLLKAIKFVYGNTNGLDMDGIPAAEELKAIQHVRTIRHPFLLSMERVETIHGELLIVLELADMSLHDLLTHYQQAGRPGLPREDLLGYLRETAEALDLMNLQYDLQHLDIKPRNLFLVSNHVKVGDFGLVNPLGRNKPGEKETLQLGAITPLYASPEVFQGRISRASDQYSLAIVYQELLTGQLPFVGKNARQLLLQHAIAEPDLEPLPEGDRAAVARALAKDPGERFPSCADFVRALAGEPHRVFSPGGIPDLPEPEGDGEADTDEAGRGTARMNGPKEDTRTGRSGGGRSGECVAGHRLVDCLHCNPLSEVWRAEAADGTGRLIKFLYGFAQRAGRQEDGTISRLQEVQHPALLPVEILDSAPGKILLVSPLVEKTFRHLLQECQARGLPGVPRSELLGHLRGVAAGLDFLQQRHGVQHLGLNPRNLLLDGDRVLVGDFGLAHLLWLPAGQPFAQLNARYSAPELLRGEVHPSSDQYSLALLYHEMLTGSHAGRKTGPGGADEVPALDHLPTGDRAVIARALDPDPGRRWPSCTAFLRALEEAGTGPNDEPQPAGPAGASPPAEAGDVLQARYSTPLPLPAVYPRLEAFCRQWHGEVVTNTKDRFVCRMLTPRSFWQRWIGRRPGLEINIRLFNPPGGTPSLVEVAVEIQARDCGKKQSVELLRIIGPLLLESVRTSLQVQPMRRVQERLTWHYPLQAHCVFPDGKVGEVIECQGKDISLNGIGFYLPCELPTSQVRLHLPETPQTPRITVPARVVRVQGCGNGWFEVGAVLLAPATAGPAGEKVSAESPD